MTKSENNQSNNKCTLNKANPRIYINAMKYNSHVVVLCSFQSVSRPAQGFLRDILHADCRAATDVYALMFLTDVIDFIIIIFGFWAFGVSEGWKICKY